MVLYPVVEPGELIQRDGSGVLPLMVVHLLERYYELGGRSEGRAAQGVDIG